MKNTIQYKAIPGYPNYMATSDGNIYSVKRDKFLKASLSAGYPQVGLSQNGKLKSIKVHSLILRAFSVKPEGHNITAHHINHIKTDNRLQNLCYVTHQQNIQFALAEGRIKTGDSHSLSTKRDCDVVNALVDILQQKQPKTDTGRKYGLSIQYLNQVLYGKLRRSVWKDPKLSDYRPLFN